MTNGQTPVGHVWVILQTFTLSEEQARAYIEAEEGTPIEGVGVTAVGPTCWKCELEYEQIGGQPCPADGKGLVIKP